MSLKSEKDDQPFLLGTEFQICTSDARLDFAGVSRYGVAS